MNLNNNLKPKTNKQVHILWGGIDWDPSWYNEKRQDNCGWSNIKRDERELTEIDYYVRHNIPIIGICRGAQGLCIADGGKLIQHIDIQLGQKLIKEVATDFNYKIEKTHHQVCVLRPYDPNDKENNPQLLAYSTYKDTLIPEVVYYPTLNAIGIQGHPEIMPYNHPTNLWLFDLINKKLNININSWYNL
jgi:gamma-glutamyl-gamma-aminobutyrate hydrolase PuuD